MRQNTRNESLHINCVSSKQLSVGSDVSLTKLFYSETKVYKLDFGGGNMSRIVRWEPSREIRRMQDAFDRMIDRAFWDSAFYGGDYQGTLPLDVYQTVEDVVVKATAPGMKAEDINISITGDTLTIRAETSEEIEEEGVEYYLRERRAASFSRSITLPTSVDSDKAKAEFEDGVLTLTLPKIEEVKPKTITVKAKG